MEGKLIEIATRLLLSRRRKNNEENDNKLLIILAACVASFIIVVGAAFTYMVLNPIETLSNIFSNMNIVQNIKDAVASKVIGGDDYDYEGDGTVSANASLSDEEMAALMSDPDINDVIKKAIAFCDSKIKAGCSYSQSERTSGEAFDCSSLMWYAYRDAGILLSDSQGHNGWPPSAALEAKWCDKNKLVVDYKDVRPGDLLFFKRTAAAKEGRFLGIGHVSMYIGNGMMVEAKGRSYGLVYSEVKTGSLVLVGRPVLITNK